MLIKSECKWKNLWTELFRNSVNLYCLANDRFVVQIACIMNYKLLTDEILIKLLKADDETALNEIYLRYWKCLYFSSLKKVRIKEIAEELVQNIFISLWDRRHLANITHLSGYLQTAI